MLSNECVSADLYNSLPTIDEEAPPSPIALQSLGETLVSAGVSQFLGVSLLHRHYLLPHGSVMVHEGLRCGPAPASCNLSGASFFLHAGKFQAFEYETDSAAAEVPVEFLKSFANRLEGLGLEKRIALSRLDLNHPKLMEHCEDPMTHVCEVTGADICEADATEWKFVNENGVVVPVITRGCARTSSRDHKKK